jgi:hypothetical protein
MNDDGRDEDDGADDQLRDSEARKIQRFSRQTEGGQGTDKETKGSQLSDRH